MKISPCKSPMKKCGYEVPSITFQIRGTSKTYEEPNSRDGYDRGMHVMKFHLRNLSETLGDDADIRSYITSNAEYVAAWNDMHVRCTVNEVSGTVF